MANSAQPKLRNFYCMVVEPKKFNSILRFEIFAATSGYYLKTKKKNREIFMLRSPELMQIMDRQDWLKAAVDVESRFAMGSTTCRIDTDKKKMELKYDVSPFGIFEGRGVASLLRQGMLKYLHNTNNGHYRDFKFSGFSTKIIPQEKSLTVESAFNESSHLVKIARMKNPAPIEFTTQNHPTGSQEKPRRPLPVPRKA